MIDKNILRKVKQNSLSTLPSSLFNLRMVGFVFNLNLKSTCNLFCKFVATTLQSLTNLFNSITTISLH